jgi:hypothetical protein
MSAATTPITYSLKYISDLFKVPVEKRERCMRELLYSLNLGELAFGDKAAEYSQGFTWTDDDSSDVTVIANGEELLKLEITPLQPEA